MKIPSIPPYHDMLPQIKQCLQNNAALGLIYIDATPLTRHESTRSPELLRHFYRIITELRGKFIRHDDLVTVDSLKGEEVFIFLSKKRRERKYQNGDLESLCHRIQHHINESLMNMLPPHMIGRHRVLFGYSIVIFNPIVSKEHLIGSLIEDGKKMAAFLQFRDSMRNKEKLQELILKEEISTLFQPIVQIAEKRIIGFEALSRGPAGTEYENPYSLFELAKQSGLIFEIDRLCKKRALANAFRLRQDLKLFVNCLPVTIEDPEFQGDYLRGLLKASALKPGNIVLEISEREVVDDIRSLHDAINYYSHLGFLTAVDDTGAGYSNMEMIVELKPNFIKLDISMVRDVHTNHLKQELIRSLVSLSEKMGAAVIAEGVETVDEDTALRGLNVPFCQGYLYARPSAQPLPVGEANPPILQGNPF